jgi:hypothetical protein
MSSGKWLMILRSIAPSSSSSGPRSLGTLDPEMEALHSPEESLNIHHSNW